MRARAFITATVLARERSCGRGPSLTRRMPRPRLLPNLAPFRDSRDLRLVVGGDFVSGMGAQATLVALPYQLYVQTHSALLVGLLGAVELGPLIAMALIGGAIADRMDRRTLLVLDQIGVFVGRRPGWRSRPSSVIRR